jgi:hypothetical protein
LYSSGESDNQASVILSFENQISNGIRIKIEGLPNSSIQQRTQRRKKSI